MHAVVSFLFAALLFDMAYSGLHLEIKRVEGSSYPTGLEKSPTSPQNLSDAGDASVPVCVIGAHSVNYSVH